MRCLEEMTKINQNNVTGQNADGWTVNGQNGVVIVTCPETVQVGFLNVQRVRRFRIDCSNPFNTDQLIAFHKRSDVPDSIKHRVEMIASQHRRIVHTTESWADMLLRSV